MSPELTSNSTSLFVYTQSYTNECTTQCYLCGGSHYITNCPRKNGTATTTSSTYQQKKTSPFQSMKVTELKVACKDRGLSVSGRKADLVERLNTCKRIFSLVMLMLYCIDMCLFVTLCEHNLFSQSILIYTLCICYRY